MLTKGDKIIAGTGTITPLLTSIWSDHILNDISWLRADTFSWQSGDVYTAAYQHLLADYESAEEKTEYYSSNVQLVGHTKDNKGILSGMTANTSYATMPFKTPTTSMEIVIKCHTPATFNTNNQLIGRLTGNNNGLLLRFTSAGVMRVWVSSNGSSWNLISDGAPGITLLPDKDYWIKAMWDGQRYSFAYSENGTDYTVGATSWANTNPIYCANRLLTLGGDNSESYPFLGTIDLNESYADIDGERFWNGCEYFTYSVSSDGHRFVTPEAQDRLINMYNTRGVAWYYVIDTDNRRFKLPRTRFGFTGLRDSVGGYVEPGLPNITGRFVLFDATVDGKVFKVDGSAGTWPYGGSAGGKAWVSFDASRSSVVYGNSNTVQQPATQMYLYFYVGQFTQTATEQTAGLNAELFNGKVDKGHEVIAFQAPTAANNYTWYRKYADGWVEQGGNVVLENINTRYAGITVHLPVTMADTNYTATGTAASINSFSTVICCIGLTETGTTITKTTSSFWLGFERLYENTASKSVGGSWRVEGMAA